MSCVYKNPCDGSPKSAGSACNQYNHDLPQPNPCKTHRPKGIDSKACDLFIHDMVEKRIGNGGGRLLALEDFLRSQIQRGTLPPIQRARGLSKQALKWLKTPLRKVGAGQRVTHPRIKKVNRVAASDPAHANEHRVMLPFHATFEILSK